MRKRQDQRCQTTNEFGGCNDGSEEVWNHSAITTGAGVMAFVLVITAACIFYFRRIYLERKHRGPMGVITFRAFLLKLNRTHSLEISLIEVTSSNL
ncbi:hypothetical protein AVEN_109344-1 [Araneus ventricosus]|uniref:Uncharacterized protein n=1 Tax=Araneus ventricosus TaxID=182803 RepID=A0A4Y2D1K8_ARAVE|nr:hypothetical protein AVEN_109344-1 [Araneus ventricosus]